MSQPPTIAPRRGRLAAELPDFPWDSLAEAKALASAHPDGIVDLSVGTPIDPTPGIGRQALAAAADSPGYPQTAGTPALRQAIAGYLSSHGVKTQRLITIGAGEGHPVASNDTEQGRSANRRVELTIVPVTKQG